MLSPAELPAVHEALRSSSQQRAHPALEPVPIELLAAAQSRSKRAAALLEAQPSMADAVARANPLCLHPDMQLVDVLDALAEVCHVAVFDIVTERAQGVLHMFRDIPIARFPVVARVLPQLQQLRSLTLCDPSTTGGQHDSADALYALAPALNSCSHLQTVRLEGAVPVIRELLRHLAGLGTPRELTLRFKGQARGRAAGRTAAAKQQDEQTKGADGAALYAQLAHCTQLTQLRLRAVWRVELCASGAVWRSVQALSALQSLAVHEVSGWYAAGSSAGVEDREALPWAPRLRG
jgi:hypothetical protein